MRLVITSTSGPHAPPAAAHPSVALPRPPAARATHPPAARAALPSAARARPAAATAALPTTARARPTAALAAARRPIALPAARLTAALAAGVVIACGAVAAAPAHAAIRFDFSAGTGSVDAADLRRSFGWDEKTLRARAADLKFTKGTLIQDVYSVVCGPAGTPPARSVHARQFATEFLIPAIDRGPDGTIRAVRITGPEAGISGTTAPPTPGLPCPGPADDPGSAGSVTATESLTPSPGAGKTAPAPADTVTSAVVVSTTTTLTLTAESNGTRRELLKSHRPLCTHPSACRLPAP